MKIVVTGSSGLLGAHIVRVLRQRHQVRGLDLVAGPETDRRCDLRERRDVLAAVSRADAMVHTAALHAPHLGTHDADAFRQANVCATEHLLHAAHSAGADRFVFTSSTSVYGHALVSNGTVWVDESLSPQPRDTYDETKLAAEARVLAATESMACTVLRVSRCFPEPANVMAMYRLHRGVDRRDVTHAIERALLTAPSRERRSAIYVISGPTPFMRNDLDELATAPAALIRRRCPAEAHAFEARGGAWPTRVDRVYSSALAGTEIGYRPQYGLAAVLDGDCDPAPSGNSQAAATGE